METFIFEFIKMRMTQLGYKSFHWIPSHVAVPINAKVHFNGQNEYYYVFDVNSQAGDVFRIKADNDIITQANFILSGVPYLFFELTGNIYVDTNTAPSNCVYR